MATKAESQGKIAAYVAKYSNASSGAGYKSSIEGFLRSVYGLEKTETVDGKKKKINHDYESLIDQYLNDQNRKNSQDVKTFSGVLVKNSVSKQSARQVLTYAVKFLKANGVAVSSEFVQDIKRECKGGAATVAKPLKGEMICNALRGASVRDRAIILTLASSGMRIGEVLSLDMKDIEIDSNPVKITIRAAKAKNKHSRFTYCSTEAKDAIKAWMSVRDEFLQESSKHNQNLITNGRLGVNYIAAPLNCGLLFPVSDSQINASWETCLKKAGLYIKDEESGRNIYRLHSLRKFFDTTLSNTAMPEKLVQYFVGHLSELSNKYYVPSEEFAAAEYLKYEDQLVCCVPEKVKATMKAHEVKINRFEKVVDTLEEDKREYKESNEYLRSKIAEIASLRSDVETLTLLLHKAAPQLFEKTDINKLDAATGIE